MRDEGGVWGVSSSSLLFSPPLTSAFGAASTSRLTSRRRRAETAASRQMAMARRSMVACVLRTKGGGQGKGGVSKQPKQNKTKPQTRAAFGGNALFPQRTQPSRRCLQHLHRSTAPDAWTGLGVGLFGGSGTVRYVSAHGVSWWALRRKSLSSNPASPRLALVLPHPIPSTPLFYAHLLQPPLIYF